jgi:hypothetical protein
MKMKIEHSEELRVDTGNPNYRHTHHDTWFRIYSRNGRLLKSFRRREDAEKFMKERQ